MSIPTRDPENETCQMCEYWCVCQDLNGEEDPQKYYYCPRTKP